MAANWQAQTAQGQYPYQPTTGYQQPQAGYQQQQHPAYSDPAYQQYYAQYYAAQQQQAWAQSQYAQQYQTSSWPQGQYPQQYPQQWHAPQPQAIGYQQPTAPTSQPFQQSSPPITHPAPQQSTLHNPKGASCFNCGAHDHWGANCPQPSRSSFSAPVPNLVAQPLTQGKGPIVTKYAVPPHVLAQMKARGVPGVAAVASTPVVQPPQPTGWQPWAGQGYSQTPVQPFYPQPNLQGAPYSGIQNHSTELNPESGVTNELTTTTEVIPQSGSGGPSTLVPETDPVTGAIVSQKDLVSDNGQNVSSNDTTEETEEESNIELLDIPDMPSSYGTSEYREPKLVSKPVYSVAPDWTSSGFGEITISQDPDGYTQSDYIKADDIEALFASIRASANEEDPIFATIDLDAPATVVSRSRSGESHVSEAATPQSYGSGDTRPTSLEEYHEWEEYTDRRRSRSPPRYERHEQRDHNDRPTRREPQNRQRQRRKKKRDRRERNKEERGPNGRQAKKRKRGDNDAHNDARAHNGGPSAKKRQTSTVLQH